MKWFKLISINIALLLVFLGVLDYLWGVVDPSNVQASRAIRLREHPALLQMEIPIEGEAPFSSTHFRTDANGYILPHGGNENASQAIYFVGGSTTECYNMPETSRFPHLVGNLLNKSGKNVKTINAGVSGNHSLSSLNVILNKIAPNKPKAIVLMHAINDVNMYMQFSNYWSITSRYSNLQLMPQHHGNVMSRLLPVLTPKIKSIWSSNVVQKSTFFDLNEALRTRLKDDFKRNLTLFVMVSKQFGSQPILMTQAKAFSLEADSIHLLGVSSLFDQGIDYMEQYILLFDGLNQVTRTVARENQIMLIDADSVLTNKQELFYDAIHFNEEGSRTLSELISVTINKKILW